MQASLAPTNSQICHRSGGGDFGAGVGVAAAQWSISSLAASAKGCKSEDNVTRGHFLLSLSHLNACADADLSLADAPRGARSCSQTDQPPPPPFTQQSKVKGRTHWWHNIDVMLENRCIWRRPAPRERQQRRTHSQSEWVCKSKASPANLITAPRHATLPQPNIYKIWVRAAMQFRPQI